MISSLIILFYLFVLFASISTHAIFQWFFFQIEVLWRKKKRKQRNVKIQTFSMICSWWMCNNVANFCLIAWKYMSFHKSFGLFVPFVPIIVALMPLFACSKWRYAHLWSFKMVSLNAVNFGRSVQFNALHSNAINDLI